MWLVEWKSLGGKFLNPASMHFVIPPGRRSGWVFDALRLSLPSKAEEYEPAVTFKRVAPLGKHGGPRQVFQVLAISTNAEEKPTFDKWGQGTETFQACVGPMGGHDHGCHWVGV